MARRTVYLHVGLADTGTAFVEGALLAHTEGLATVGVEAPAISAEEMFRMALEILRMHKDYGYTRSEVEGTWAALCRRFRRGRGTVVLSQELLAAADADQAALLLDGLAGFEVHLVLTVRDPAAQLTAAWAEHVKSGESVSFGGFRDQITAPERDTATARRFWAAQDVEGVLARWSALVRPNRIHVVPVAQIEDPRTQVWQELGRIVGFDATAFPLGPRAVQPELGPTEIAVLRGVNRAIDGRIDGQLRRTVVKRYFAERVLGAPDAVTTPVPARAYGDLVDLAERWQKVIANKGYDVRGNLDELIPSASRIGKAGVKRADRLQATTDALADVLVEVARLREHNEQLEIRNAKLEKKRAKLQAKLIGLSQ